jgi:branched-chain amino acid transport system substrate-binding protein
VLRPALSLVVAALLLAGCGAGPPDHVRVGVVAPLTGTRAWLGQEVAAGAALAVDDLNRDGGLLGQPVELVLLDDADLAGLPGQLADLAERAHVSAVIGPEAPGVLLGPRSPLTRREVPALLASAFGGDLDAAGSLVGRTIPSARAQAERLATWLTDERDIDRVAVLVADPVEGDLARADLEAGLAAGGAAATAVVVADGDAADLRPSVASLRAAAGDAQAVLLWAPPAAAARATTAVRDLRWDVQLMVPASAFVGEYRTLADDAAEGVVAAFPYRQDWFTSGSLFGWMLRYHARHGIGLLAQLETVVLDLPVVAIAAYDAVTIVAAAVEHAGSREPAAVAAALTATTYEGLLTTYDLGRREAWGVDDLHVARFHELAITFDVDPALDGEFQRYLWQAQITLDVLPEEVRDGPLGALIDRVLADRQADPPAYRAPLPPPAPVGRP